MELREYRTEDFEKLWELDQRCFSSQIAYSRRELAHYLRSKTAISFVAWDAQRLLGFAVGESDRRGFGHVITLDVEPADRKSGVGSALMEALERRFRAADCKSIFLEVAVDNRAALRFYKKHGYSVLKTLRHYYPGDLDGLLMGKRIEQQVQNAG